MEHRGRRRWFFAEITKAGNSHLLPLGCSLSTLWLSIFCLTFLCIFPFRICCFSVLLISSVKRIWLRLKPNNLTQFLSPVTLGHLKAWAPNKNNKQTKEMEKKKYNSSVACPQQQQYHSTKWTILSSESIRGIKWSVLCRTWTQKITV